MQDIVPSFGFNIITERKEIEDDDDSYERGESTRQYDKPYTDDADILQSILKYSINFGTENYFISRNLSIYHLLENCTYYKELYKGDKTPKKGRLESMNPRVVSLLNKLIHLKLIEFEFYETDNHQISERYKFTKFGRLIGLLISYKTDLIKISKDLHNHIIDFYDSMDHPFAKLCSIFFRRCYNTPTYDKTIKNLVDLLENAEDDKNLLINQIIKFTPILSKESWSILYDSFDEFDKRYPLQYEVLLYNLKLYLEEIHERKSRNLIGFEKWRFLLINEPFEAALEGYCNNCYKYSIVKTGIINYFGLYVNMDPNARSDHLVIACPNPDCKNGFLDLEFIDKISCIIRNNLHFLI